MFLVTLLLESRNGTNREQKLFFLFFLKNEKLLASNLLKEHFETLPMHFTRELVTRTLHTNKIFKNF